MPLRDIDSDDVFGHDLLLLAMRAQSPSNRSSEWSAAEELAEERAQSPRMTRSAATSGPVGGGQTSDSTPSATYKDEAVVRLEACAARR
jgi:hypothetical protein